MNNDINTIYSNITNAVNFQTKKSPAFDQLIKFQNSIINNLILPNPYESFTPDFIDNFSVKLIKNILNTAVNDLILVNTFSTILENYIQILIFIFEQPNLAFLEAATQIANPNNVFYVTLSQKNLPPTQYNKIINRLKTNDFYQQLSNFFERHDTLTLKHISILITLLIAVKEESENYNKCICIICQKVISIIQSFNYDDIREIDDKVLNSTLDSISSIESKYLGSDCALNIQLQINIRFAKSDILEKRFNGINQIVTIIKNESNRTQSKICQIVNEQQILDGILNDFHNQLVKPFISILTQFIQNKINVQNYLVSFWKVSINQHSSIAPEFFNGWKTLISNRRIKSEIFEQYSQALFDEISISLTLPEAQGKEASLSFLNEISSCASEPQKVNIFNALIQNSNLNCNIDLLSNTISFYMPKDSENIKEQIMKESLEMIENNYNIHLAFTLITNLKLNHEQSNHFLNSLLNSLNTENSKDVISLLFKLLKQNGRQLEESQFLKILDIYLPQLENEDVLNFFINTVSLTNAGKSVYSHDMRKTLYKSVCELPTFNDNFIPLTLQLFEKINMERGKTNVLEIKELNQLWKLAFRTGNEGVIDYIRAFTNTVQFVDKCMKNIKVPGALECLNIIIKKIEPSMNNHVRWILKMPFANEYIDEDNLFPVKLTGSVEMTLFLSIGTTFAALKNFLCLFVKTNNKYYVILSIKGKQLANFDTVIEGPMTIDVKVNNSRNEVFNYNYYNEIPTLILFSNATYTVNLMNLMEDEQYGPTVLKILNKMPTLPNFVISFEIDEENNQIDESNDFTRFQWDWNQFLSFDEPVHLIYHLNTIGNCLNHNDIEWTRWFFNTGGAFKLIDMLMKTKDSKFDMLNESQDKFNEKDFLLLLFIVRKILSLDLNNEINDIIENINDGVFIEFLNYSLRMISNDDFDSVSFYLLVIIEKMTLVRKLRDVIDPYIELFELSCFHKNKKIRVFANEFIHKKEIQSTNIMIQLLPKAISKNNSDFINSIISLVNESNHIDNLKLIWNTLLDSTFNCFALLKNKDLNGIWLNLNAPYPHDDFIQVLLTSFTKLINSFESNKMEIPRIDELYFFLFDDILYNQVIYYRITPKLIDLLKMIIHNKPPLIKDSIPRIKKIQEDMSNVVINNNDRNKKSTLIENNLNDGPESHIKGLRNLGATCYMGSLLQQLYSIPIFRSTLLNLDLSIQKDTNKKENENINVSNNNNNESNTNENNVDQASNVNQITGINDVANNNEDTSSNVINDASSTNKVADTDEIASSNEIAGDKKEDDYKWLYELQYLFLKMLIYPTSSSSIDPSSFVNEWKGWDGNPIDPHQQQDAEEYLSLLLSRLEPKLPIVDTLFKGKIKSRIQGEGKFITYNKYTDEDYFGISLEVKGHKNVSSSLEAFKSPDRFEGANKLVTDELGPIDAIQTHLILQQSPVLIITLKRFQFNMTTLVKEKINTKYEFPLSLDISPILIPENKSSSKYELSGVILHKGTADAGHYISHIKGSDDNWRVFNDAQVQVETVKEMMNDCYGGSDVNSYMIDDGSAYILFYRRVDYDFNEGNLPVSSQLITRLAEDIKKDILTEISSSEEYFKFIASIIEDPEFLLSLLSSKSGIFKRCCEIILKSCINRCKSTNDDSRQFSESILFYYSKKASDFIVNINSEVTKEMITNSSLITLVKEALSSPSVPFSSLKDFIIGLVMNIKEIEEISEANSTKEIISLIDEKLEIYSNNILLFYEIVHYKNNQIDTSQMVNVLVDYLTKNKQGRNTGSIVNLLIKMDSNNKQGINNISSFFTDEMLLNYFKTDKTKEILSLTIKRIKNDNSKLDLLFSFSSNEYSNPMILSKLFICILSSRNQKPQQKLKIIGIEGKNYMEIFFSKILPQFNIEILNSMVKHVMNFIPYFIEDTFETFIAYSDILVEKLIFSLNFDVRKNACSIFLKFMMKNENDSSKARAFFNIYKSLIKRLDFLQNTIIRLVKDDRNSYSYLANSLQVEHYFYLLGRIVNICKFNDNILQQSENLANFLINTTIQFEKFHEPCFVRKFVLEFIIEAVKKDKSIEFFGEQGEILGYFMQGIPFFQHSSYFSSDQMNELETYADTYIRFMMIIPVKLFYFIANTNFMFEILKSKKYMSNQYAKRFYKYLCNDYLEYYATRNMNYVSNFANIFFSGCLSCHLESGRVVPIKIAVFIMKKYPELSNFFFNNSLYSNALDFINRMIKQYVHEKNRSRMPIDTSVFPLMHLLGVFIENFATVPGNKVSYFFTPSNYQSVSTYFEKNMAEPMHIIQFSLLERNSKNYSINSKGSFVFLRSLFDLNFSQRKKEEIYDAILPFLSYENGFISHVPMKAKHEATNFMLTVLKWASKATNLLSIGPFSNRISTELSSFITSIFQRESLESSVRIDEITRNKEKKCDKEVLSLLSKETLHNIKYINAQSIHKLFEAFRSLMIISEGSFYFSSKEMINLCIFVMRKMNYVPLELIQSTQTYLLNVVRNDYTNETVNDFINAAKIIDEVVKQFNVEVPKIQIDPQAKENIDKWAKKAQEGRTPNDDFVAFHLFIIFFPK